MKLTAHEVFMDCLFKKGEPQNDAVIVKGVMLHIGFNPIKIEKHKQDIEDLLSGLPDSFKASGGGGYTFLNACDTKDGKQWADMHKTMDELVCLGLATGKVEFCMPRDHWSILPGGMPYFMIKDAKEKQNAGS